VIPLGHIGGVPLEELLPALAGPAGGLLATRAWLALHLKRQEPKR
jgi:hypothetical protein